MKAMILAAGLGTRLLPFTEDTPKALFPIAGRPLLDIIIHSLQHAGCKAVIINTHHLHQKIDSFIAGQKYTIPVYTRYEPVILGTGGAIKNAADFWNDQPFIVINSDIVTDIDLRKVYEFHLKHEHPATLVVHDCTEFNSVSVNKNNFITGFNTTAQFSPPCHSERPQGTKNLFSRLKYSTKSKILRRFAPQNDNLRCSVNDQGEKENCYIKKLAFTGIQVLDPKVLGFIPDNVFSSSIDMYEKLISDGKKVKAFISKQYYWKDIGTPERYKEAIVERMAPEAFKLAWPDYLDKKIKQTKLKGDGSDRIWYRLTAGSRSLVMADHGIRTERATSEIDSFVAIGRHLHDRGISVPEIYLYDTFSGLVFMEDMGDVNLQKVVLQKVVRDSENLNKIISCYKSIIYLIIKMSVSGSKGFDLSWTYQTPSYSRDLILEKECRYFVDAFLNRYLGMDLCFEDFKDEFISLADRALEFSVDGFMHRDLQSRNIMVKNNKFYFIDFQGGRIGPIQYDLASLLIDPYVKLPCSVQAQLLDYCVERLSSFINVDKEQFCLCFKYCAITRNLQILGAFGYLSRVMGKTYFEQYIPAALETLKYNLSVLKDAEFPGLKSIVKEL